MDRPTIRPPLIAAIVCTCDRYDLLGGCLDSLLAQTLPCSAREIIVVDNSTEVLARQDFYSRGGLPAGVRLIVSDRPGLSRARNLGVAATQAALVAFIDDDARAGPEWLAELAAVFAGADGVAVCGGRVVPVWPVERPAWLGAAAEGFFSLVDRGASARDLGAGEWLAGTNIAFRRAALMEAGGFDEALGRMPGTLLGNEEIAVAERLRRAGHAIRYAPEALVRHVVDPARLNRAWLRRRIAWQAISDLLSAGGESGSVASLWQTLSDFLGAMPPECRNLVGLTRDLDDPAMVLAQGEAIAALVRLLAGHGASLEATLLAA